MANVDEFSNTLLRSGFGNITKENDRVTFEFDSAEDYARFTQEIAAPVNLLQTNEIEKRKPETCKTVIEYIKLHHIDSRSEHVRLDYESICIAGSPEWFHNAWYRTKTIGLRQAKLVGRSVIKQILIQESSKTLDMIELIHSKKCRKILQ